VVPAELDYKVVYQAQQHITQVVAEVVLLVKQALILVAMAVMVVPEAVEAEVLGLMVVAPAAPEVLMVAAPAVVLEVLEEQTQAEAEADQMDQ